MAKGVELATAYVSLTTSTGGIKKEISAAFDDAERKSRTTGRNMGQNMASAIKAALTGSMFSGEAIFAPMIAGARRSAAKMGAMMATAIRSAVMTAVGGLGLGGAVGIGGILFGGLDRLKVLQQAQVQLKVLKKSSAEIKDIMNDVLAVVDKTPISLQEAMSAVPSALSANLNMSRDQLKQYLADIGDAAASTGGQAGFQQIGRIFDQIAGKGKLMGEDLMQLQENGVAMRGALMSYFKTDAIGLDKLMKRGKVGIKEVQAAVQQAFGGMSRGMGDTFQGSMDNLTTGFKKLGASIITAIFGGPDGEDPMQGLTLGVQKATEAVGGLTNWVKAHREDIRQFFEGGAKVAKDVVSGIKSVWKWLGDAKRVAEDFGAAVGRAWTRAGDVLSSVKTKFSNLIDDVKTKWDSIFGEDGWFSRQFKKVEKLIGDVKEALGFGPAKANAGDVPFNPGPKRPGADAGAAGSPFAGSRASGSTNLNPLGSGPMDFLPGAGGDAPAGGIFGNGTSNPAAGTPVVVSPSSLHGMIPKGRYVGAEEFRTGDATTLADLTLGLGDCTSTIQDLVNIIEGKPTAGRALSDGSSMFTGNIDQWAKENGFIPTAVPMPGTFQVGASDSHAQATLPDGRNWNWGDNASAAQRGFTGSGAWGDDSFRPTKHFYKRYDSGGRVSGPGTATSDSIVGLLSNGEHVLTAKDVEAMGGQNGVYAFRSALQAGLIPGFDDGGAVDPDKLRDVQNRVSDLGMANTIAQAQLAEMDPAATRQQRRQAEINAGRADREYRQAIEDMTAYSSGRQPRDFSEQNRLIDATDAVELAQLGLAQAQDNPDTPASQMMQAEYGVQQALRDRQQAIDETGKKEKSPSFIDNLIRTQGFTPSGGGGKAGTSSLAKIIQMPSEFAGGLIDTAANLGSMAASAAIAAGAAASGGPAAAGAAASPALSYGFSLAATEAKVISDYWLGTLPGIGADALVAQMFPFGGPPRWMGYDYTGMMPQLGIQQAALTTLEQMGGQAIKDYFNPNKGVETNVPGLPMPVSGSATMSADGPVQQHLRAGAPQNPPGSAPPSGAMQGSATIPPSGDEAIRGTVGGAPWLDPNFIGGAGGNGGGGSWAKGGHVGVYDQGGILNPGDIAVNKSKIPEKVLTQKQWDAMAAQSKGSGRDAPLVKIDNIYGMSPEDVANQIEQKQRLATMQFSGRP